MTLHLEEYYLLVIITIMKCVLSNIKEKMSAPKSWGS